MRIISINVTYARTFNLGEYNSMRLECALSADLDEDEDPAAAQAELWQLAKDSVKAQALPVLKRREDEIAAIRDSLPPGTVN
jgi:hypothetical protein